MDLWSNTRKRAAGELAVLSHHRHVVGRYVDALHHRGEDGVLGATVDAVGILVLVDADGTADVALGRALLGFLDEVLDKGGAHITN